MIQSQDNDSIATDELPRCQAPRISPKLKLL